MPRVAKLEHPCAALATDVNGAEVGDTGGAEVVESLERLRRGTEHRVDQVRAGARRGQHVGEEDALSELRALLFGQRPLGLGRHLLPARDEARVALGGRDEQLLVAQRSGHPLGELVVDLLDAGAEEALARLVGPVRCSRG